MEDISARDRRFKKQLKFRIDNNSFDGGEIDQLALEGSVHS